MSHVIDWVVVPGIAARIWSDPHPDHPTHSNVLEAHRGAEGPFESREAAESQAKAMGFGPEVVMPRRTIRAPQ